MSAAIEFEQVLAAPGDASWGSPLTLTIQSGVFHVVRTAPRFTGLLLRLAAGLVSPEQGTIRLLGREPALLSRRELQQLRRGLGVGLQPDGLISNLTVRMNLVVPLLYSGDASPAAAGERADATLETCRLVRWADTRPADLPPEVRKEAVLARAIVRKPALLLLDNPVSTLDEERGKQLLSLCRDNASAALITVPARDAVLYQFADAVSRLNEDGLVPEERGAT